MCLHSVKDLENEKDGLSADGHRCFQRWYDHRGVRRKTWRQCIQHPPRRKFTQAVVRNRWVGEYVHLRILRFVLERGHDRGGRHRVCQRSSEGSYQMGWQLGRRHQAGGTYERWCGETPIPARSTVQRPRERFMMPNNLRWRLLSPDPTSRFHSSSDALSIERNLVQWKA